MEAEFENGLLDNSHDPVAACWITCSILISGPTQPDVDMDVFLEPLMEDMKKLWEEGMAMWDEFCKEPFTLKAMIFLP
jgi:hypothetical protein